MEQKRFVETGKTLFFGEYLYDQMVPANRFLSKLTCPPKTDPTFILRSG